MNNLQKSTILILGMALALTACGGQDEKVARWPTNIYEKADKSSKRITFIQKGERVKLIKEEGGFFQVELADSKIGFVEAQATADKAIVITSDDVKLMRRPSASSGSARTADNIKKASVAFVMESAKNDEGEWIKLVGGFSKNPVFKNFDGWIKKGYGYDDGGDLVSMAIELENAVLKNDSKKLEELANESAPVGDAAAGRLVEMQGDTETPLEQETETAPGEEAQSSDEKTEPAKTTTDAGNNAGAPAQ